jgi:predicted  nucleic acid-binding Zn-ribbon protein
VLPGLNHDTPDSLRYRGHQLDVTIWCMSQVDQLLHLQQIDDEIKGSKTRLSQVIRLQGESEKLAAVRKRAEETEVELHHWRGKQTDINLELSSLDSKAKRSEDRLYSGLVKNPKELEDLQHEIDSLGRRRVIIEDELLEVMIMVEEAENENAEAVEALDKIQSEWEQDQANLRKEQATLVQRLKELADLRGQQLEFISPASLASYESAIRRAGTTAVVPLKNNLCRGCQVRVPENLVKAADEGKLVTCDSCGRILCPT